MAKMTRSQKTQANKGIRQDILEVILTTDGSVTTQDILNEIGDDWPHADGKTVSNCVSLLHREGKVRKLPSVKGTRGSRWTAPKDGLAKLVDKTSTVGKMIEAGYMTAEDVGRTMITAIMNMKKTIEKQLDQIAYLEKTIKNMEGSHKLQETTLRNSIRERDKVIASLKAQLEPDPEMMFKLADIANFTGKEKST